MYSLDPIAAETSAKPAEEQKAPHGQPMEPVIDAIDADGTVHISAFALPLSPYLSHEAKQRFIENAKQARKAFVQTENLPAEESASPVSRCSGKEAAEEWLRPLMERGKALYSVNVEERNIAGVRTDVVTPRGRVSLRMRNRVLIQLHGGGFDCAVAGGLLGIVQSIPIAGIGKVKVIAIDYRSSPEFKFPAATEDVAAVYRKVLESYKPSNIGIYGSSTGATLTAGSVVWFQKEKLPRPGAIVLIGQGAEKDDVVDGDAWYLALGSMGENVSAPGQNYETLFPEPYMSGSDRNDPLVWPALSLKVLSRFPPTLLISGTRDLGLSEVLYTHTRLVKVGVDADLHVWEGMWHGFLNEMDIPESIDAYNVVVKFFDSRLGK
jgi:acetyl esterase/lipase